MMSSLRRHITRNLGLALGVILIIAPLYAAQPDDAAASAADFKHAYDTAIADAKGSETLDPAYELLGIAGNARERDYKDLAANAATAFAELIQRASAAALRKGGTTAQDTLDQLVDLRFFAGTTQIEKTASALDTAMRSLFPVALKLAERHADTAQTWDDKLSALRDIASLQASATQVMLTDIATTVSTSFDSRASALDTLVAAENDTAEHARKLSDVAELKRSRTDQVADAANNNVNAVAQQMQSAGRTAGSSQLLRSEAGADLPPELLEGEGSCIETGYRVPGDADLHRAHDRDCVNSGRVPATGRCSTANLSMVCYSRLPNGEKLTYVYRDTPAESYFKKTCPAEDLVPASKIPKTGPAFRGTDIKVTLVCTPAGSDTSSD